MANITRRAETNWKGNLESGHGSVSTQSRSLVERPVSFKHRIDDESKTANPEELLAAAASSCFAMALSKTLQDENVVAEEIVIRADVTLSLSDAGPKVTALKIRTEAHIPDYPDDKLEQAVATTAKNCPVLKLLTPGLDSVDFESKVQR